MKVVKNYCPHPLSWFSKFVFATSLIIFFSALPAIFLVSAQSTGPITHSATVSATMPDIVPPTAPVLIAPEDGAILDTNRPQFVWKESTDNVKMSHYQLYLNGELLLDNLETTGNFSQYNLSYNSSLGYFYLDVKFDLPQGNNTWRVVAVDAVGLTNSSVTWSFLIDSIDPSFVVTQIGDVIVSISAQDESTIPEEPIILAVNQPTITATGEANSLVKLTVIIPGQDDYVTELRIDSSGNWSYILPILPRDTIITLNFIITDQAGNISTLEGIKIIIPSKIIVIPIVPISPTPKVSVTPKPGEPIITPIEKPPGKPPIEIPIKPPKEIIYELIKQITPTPIWRVTTRPWFVKLMNFLGPWLVLLITSWPIITATILLAKRVGAEGLLSFKQLYKIWQALGVLPWRDFEGLVFDANYYLMPETIGLVGLPFARVTAISQSEPEGFPPYYHQVLTNRLGLYTQMYLPTKLYKVAVTHPDYRYPSITQRAIAARVENYYKAESIEVTLENHNLSLIIPTDNDILADSNIKLAKMIKREYQKIAWSFLTRVQNWLSKVVVYQSLIVLLNVFLAGLVIIFWPSALNIIILAFYLIYGGLLLLWDTHFANIRGLVIDSNGQPVQDALVRLIKIEEENTPENKNKIKFGQVCATLTNKKGRFNYSLKSGLFKLNASLPNCVETSNKVKDETIKIDSWFHQQNVVIKIKE